MGHVHVQLSMPELGMILMALEAMTVKDHLREYEALKARLSEVMVKRDPELHAKLVDLKLIDA